MRNILLRRTLTSSANVCHWPHMSKSAERLLEIGREIAARVERLDKIGIKAVDHVDSINHLLAQAEKLCETAEAFEAFKKTHCANLGRSRTYELLAIEGGRKSLEDIRASTRARVTKHRAGKKAVTDSSSVTETTVKVYSPDAQPKPTVVRVKTEKPTPTEPTADASAEARKAQYAEIEPILVVPAEQSNMEERRRAAARSHPRNASISLKAFLNACYSFIPDLSATELAKAEEVFKQCAKEARKRAEKKKAAECAAPKASAA
jgi:hypothetical protein